MRPDYLKSIVLDTHMLASRLMSHVEFVRDELQQPWPFPFNPTVPLFHDMLIAHAKDIVEYSLCAHVRGHHPSQLDLLCQTLVGAGNMDQCLLLKRFYTEVAGMDWHEHIVAYVGTQTYDIWRIESTANTAIIVYVGDYRILEWENDHIENGEYYADPIAVRNSRC